MEYLALKPVLVGVRSLISESKTILGMALKLINSNDIEGAEKLASKALKNLDLASLILSRIERELTKGDRHG